MSTLQTCQQCQKLIQLTEENAKLKAENNQLKRSLMRYENPNTPPSMRMYPTKVGDHRSAKRFPGRPKGHIGATRPKPKTPTQIKEPPTKQICDHCGASLSAPSHVSHHVVEEYPTDKKDKSSTF